MNVDKIRKELLNLFTSENVLVYSSNKIEDKRMHSIRSSLYNEYYLLISQNNDFSYAFESKNKILKRIKDLEKNYKELMNTYNKDKDNSLIIDINNLAYQTETLKKIYDIFDNNLKAKNSSLIDISNNIIDVLKQINNTDDNSLQEKLYNLRDERRVRLTNSTNSLVINKICELESIEIRIAQKDKENKEYTLSKKEYLTLLKDSIQAINEYQFIKFKKSKFFKEEDNTNIYNSYINKYYSLISSLFNDNFHLIELDNNKMSSDDLINYLFIYNIDGNFEIFKNKNKNKLIGNKEINKTKYLKQVELLNNIIIKLIDDCSKKFKSKTITIKDADSNIKELMELRNKKISEIDNIIGDGNINGRE